MIPFYRTDYIYDIQKNFSPKPSNLCARNISWICEKSKVFNTIFIGLNGFISLMKTICLVRHQEQIFSLPLALKTVSLTFSFHFPLVIFQLHLTEYTLLNTGYPTVLQDAKGIDKYFLQVTQCKTSHGIKPTHWSLTHCL